MAYIQVNLGYGRSALIDADDAKRLLHDAMYDSEEMREDIPAAPISTYSYKGMAVSGSLTSAAVWSIIRITYDAEGRNVRTQFRADVAWDSRDLGWV